MIVYVSYWIVRVIIDHKILFQKFTELFEIVLKSDFDQIFTIVELEAATGFNSALDRELVSRTGEPMPTGLVLGIPAEEHFKDLLAHNSNAGNSDLMITSIGTQGFVESMPAENQSSCTGPFPVVGSPEEIIQTRR